MDFAVCRGRRGGMQLLSHAARHTAILSAQGLNPQVPADVRMSISRGIGKKKAKTS